MAVLKINDILFYSKECKVLKLQYKVLLFIVSLFIFTVVLLQTNAFLSKHEPLVSKVLVVEGWLPDYALEKAVQRFKEDKYTKIITTGGPLGVGSYLKEYKDYAHLAKASLLAMGMDKENVIAVAAPDVKHDRTYHSALALKQWINENMFDVQAINLASLGPHTRRSTMLFRKAFAEESIVLKNRVEIGSIAIVPEDYNPKKWYASSEGVRTTINELIAYIYVTLLK
jgi:hypothetical protein